MIVLDSSAAIELLLNTAPGRRLAERIADPSQVIHVPHLIDVEILQVLRRYLRHGNLDSDRCLVALEHWRSLDVERYAHEPLLKRAWRLKDNFSAYDAMYVALAEALGSVLVTGDRRLAGAPGANALIELI